MSIPLPTNLLPHWYFPWNTPTWSGYTPFISHKELLAVDALRQLYIWKEFAFSQLKQGVWPFWNPYNFSGQPILANFQTAVFYPLSWLYLLVNPILSWSLYILCQPVLSFIFMFLYLQNLFSRRAALFGSLAWVGSTFLTTRYFFGMYIHTLMWMPLALFCIDLYRKQKLRTPVFIALFSLTLAVNSLGGYPQFATFVVLVSSLYFLFRFGPRKWLVFGSALLLVVVLIAIQVIPTLELYRNSLREGKASERVFREGLLDVKYLETLTSPDLWGNPATNNYTGGQDHSGMNSFVGIIPLVFAVYAVRLWRKNSDVRFWSLVGVIGLLLAFRSPFAFLPRILHIPIFSSGNPWNNLFFFQLAQVMLATIGFSSYLREHKKKALFSASAFVFGLVIFVLLLNRQSASAIKPLALQSGLLMIFLLGLSNKTLLMIIALLGVSAWSSYYFWKMSPFGDSRYLYPRHFLIRYLQDSSGYDRFAGWGRAHFVSNFATYYRIYDVSGYDSLWPRSYGELVAAASNRGQLPSEINRADVFIPDQDSPERKRLLDLLSVKYVLDKSDNPLGDNGQNYLKFNVDHYSLVKQWGMISVYENKNSLSRAFLTQSYEINPQSKNVEKLFERTLDIHKTVLLGNDPQIIPQQSFVGEATIIKYSPNSLDLEAKSSGKSLLFLNDVYFPGWKAQVNGKETPIYQANYAFRAVTIPQGQSKVRFTYEPTGFYLGMILSATGIGIVICLLCSGKFLKAKGS